MQKRHSDRQWYFTELANTSREFYISYLSRFAPIRGKKILEIGCGEGGNLLPFAEAGCEVTGIDRSEERISQARSFFEPFDVKARFLHTDFFDMESAGETDKYDIILVHDVIEHVSCKDRFFGHIKQFTAGGGLVFWAFPAWQMPFGGHQQICRSKVCSALPFIHLLPAPVYRRILTAFGEPESCVDELIDIKRCGLSAEKFERLVKRNGHVMADRCLWLVNPHYKQKFGLTPRKLPGLLRVRYLRNFFSTSCFYITRCM